MITWAEKVAFVGMKVESIHPTIKIIGVYFCYKYRVRVSIPGGLCSYGHGRTVEKAIENAAIGMNMCWSSIERKMTELEWQRVSHT